MIDVPDLNLVQAACLLLPVPGYKGHCTSFGNKADNRRSLSRFDGKSFRNAFYYFRFVDFELFNKFRIQFHKKE
jgi:hypothetical protein